MTPRSFLDLICRPHVDAFVADPNSLHKAWAAVVALGQFPDYLAAGRGIPLEAAWPEIRSTFAQFDVVSNVANAIKHFQLTRPRGAKRLGLSVRHLATGQAAAFSDGTYFDDGTSYAEHPEVIRADFQGEQMDLVHLCASCLAALDAMA